MLALTLTTAESGLTLSGRWKTLYLFLKILKAHSTKLCASTGDIFTLFFLTLKVDTPKRRSLFLFSANPSSPTKNYGTFGPSVPERGF